MQDEDDHIHEESQEPKSFSGIALNKAIAILFVLGIYLIIFLKMLVLS